MSAVAETLARLALGAPQTHQNLTLVPLLGDGVAEPGYRLLDEALAEGCARVTEVSEGGSVPELRFVNGGALPVLLLDGEELLGAKQNRILNLTVLAPAHTAIVIPVSCVEAGRWHAQSADFASAGRAHYAAGRAEKAAQVSAALSASGSRRSDQGQIWADIAAKAERLGARSETAAALYATHRARLDGYLGAFAPVPAQLGALFLLNGTVLGLDLFDSARTLATLLPKLVESAALDAIDVETARTDAGDTATADTGTPGGENVAGFLSALAQAPVARFPAVGLGEDLRLGGEGLAGGALFADGRVVHLCAFTTVSREHTTTRPGGTRLARVSQRRRGWR